MGIENPVTDMLYEGGPLNPGIVEVGSNPDSHPLRRGRIRPTAEDIAGMAGPKLGQP